MINQTNVDVIALSQTWLKNDKHLEYIRLPGYEFAYRNRDEKRGWGVGIYIRDTLEFKVSDDMSNLDESTEHLIGWDSKEKEKLCMSYRCIVPTKFWK